MDIFEKYKTFVMIGKPGSGKGTQSKLLAEKTGFKIFSTGDRFREIQKQDTSLGHKTAEIMNSGGLMPYWFASYLFQEAVLTIDREDGIVYEGAARKLPEAELFNDVMRWLERPYKAVQIEVDDEAVVERLLKRKEIEGRIDDGEAAVRTRLELYNKEILPSIDFFSRVGNLVSVDGDQDPEDVFKDLLSSIEKSED